MLCNVPYAFGKNGEKIIGGAESGNWCRFDKKTTTGECQRVDVRNLHKEGLRSSPEAGSPPANELRRMNLLKLSEKGQEQRCEPEFCHYAEVERPARRTASVAFQAKLQARPRFSDGFLFYSGTWGERPTE